MKLNTIPLLSRVLAAAAALQGVSHAASPWVILDFSTPWTLAPGGGGVGTTWTKTGVDLRPGMPDMTATFTITGIGGGTTLDLVGNPTQPGNIVGLDTANPWITYNLSLTNTATGFPVTVPALRLVAFDIDSEPVGAPGTQMTDIWGWNNATSTPDLGTSFAAGGATKLEMGGFDPGFGPSGYTTFLVKPGERGVNADFDSNLAEFTAAEIPYGVFADYSNFSDGDFVWGFKGQTGLSFDRGQDMLGLQVPEPGSAMAGLVTAMGMGSVVMRRRRR
jgi:hypothetical protein